MSYKKCKKEWDEKLYKFARKRFNRINNIGWYRLFLNKLDFIHDHYIVYISTSKNFEESESIKEYCQRFSKRVLSYKTITFRKDTSQGKEFERRRTCFIQDPVWSIIEEGCYYEPKQDIAHYFDNYGYVKKFYEGYSFVEISKEQNISPTTVRERFIREASLLSNNQELKSTLISNGLR